VKLFRVAELMANGALSTGNPLKWIDYLRFGWFDPLMKLGALTTLQKEDIWYTEPRDLPENIVAELEPLWNREVERARRAGVAPSLFRAAANYMAWHWLTGSFLRCTADMMDFVRPIIMQQILLVMEGNADQAWGWVTQDNVWMLGVLMFCSAMTWTFNNVHFNYRMLVKSFRLRAGMIGLLYKKSLTLSPGAKAMYTSGKITNLMANDADKMT